MNAQRPSKITGTSAPLSDPRQSEDAAVPQVLNCSEIDATTRQGIVHSPTGGAGASNASTNIGAGVFRPSNSTVAAGAPNRDTYLDDGYGLQPRCITCRKGMSNCLCDAPDIDVPSVTDMKRIMPSLFEDSGWALAERSAYGMAVKL